MVQGHLGGEKERTEARLRAALDGLQMAVGNEDASTANAKTNLALFLKGEGQHGEAIDLYTDVLATRCGGRGRVVRLWCVGAPFAAACKGGAGCLPYLGIALRAFFCASLGFLLYVSRWS